ncbi:MAG: tetratricopeptide repeat protein [Planctomycetota bacterium]|jgi:tetratricopeptide (TPR) repeat protein
MPPIESTPISPRRRRAVDWTFACVAAIASFLAFLPALNNGFVDWDDPEVIVDNEHYRGLGPEQLRWMFTTTHMGHYQPITWVTYGVDYVLWGMNPKGYHLTSNLFHAVNALLVYFLALVILRRALDPEGGPGPPAVSVAALFVALLFGLHPLRVESVAWATERRDLVSAFFLLLTVLAYLRAAAPGGRGRARWLAVTLLIYVLSMMSKVGGAPLPVVLLVLDWYPLRRLAGGARRVVGVVLEKVPFFVIALGFAVVTVAHQSERWMYPLSTHGPLERVAQAFYGLVFYPAKTVLPFGLRSLYELRLPLDPWAPIYIASALLVVAGGVVMLLLARRRPQILAAALVFGAMIGPLLGFFQNGPQIVADRYSYLSCLSWTILIVGAALAVSMRRGIVVSRVLIGVGVAASIALAAMTWRQTETWRDSETFWGTLIAADPASSYGNNSYAAVLLSQDRLEEAVPYLETAIETSPFNRTAYHNLWGTLTRLNRPEDLEASYLEAAESKVVSVCADARYALGNLALGASRHRDAARWYRHALAVREAAPTHSNLGLTLQLLGDEPGALEHYTRAVELDPQLAPARLGLARTLFRAGRAADALPHAEMAAQLNPNDPGTIALRDQVRAAAGR